MTGKNVTFNVLDFIESVRTRPFLYDKSDEDYKDNDKRQQAWDEITLQFAFPDGKETYKKWKYFKDHYFSEKKKMKERGVDENNCGDFKKWTYYDNLKWVDGFIEKRTTPVRSGIKRPKKEIVEQPIPSTLEECIANALTPLDVDYRAMVLTPTVASERENEQHTVQPLQNVFARHKRPFSEMLTDMAGTEAAAGDAQDVSLLHRALAVQTEEELFGQLIARDLARLPTGVRSLARLKIQELLYHFSADRFPEIRA